MYGVTKHIFDHEIKDIKDMWKKQLQAIRNILPVDYNEDDIVRLLKKYYPHEWDAVNYLYQYYQVKDKYLKKHFGKARYKMLEPVNLLKTVGLFQKIMEDSTRKTYTLCYSEENVKLQEKQLWDNRKPKIEKIDKKIERAKAKVQQVTPSFIDKLIGFYNRKNTSQKDKMYILAELKKYYSPIIINFFYKLNDTELNKQLRWEAFYHLQSFNYHPRARRQKYMQVHTQNKKRKNFLKKEYPNLKYTIPFCPEELEYRIENAKEQQIKEYDYFISHSSKDAAVVQELIKAENSLGKNVFCDWINDVDYLKRHLVCDATLKVIEKRLDQSKGLIFVDSDNSKKSAWCRYELNYFCELKKPIYSITKKQIEEKFFDLELDSTGWFLDKDFKNKALLEGEKIKSQ